MRRAHKSGTHRCIQHAEECIPITGNVDEHDWLVVNAELCPGQDLAISSSVPRSPGNTRGRVGAPGHLGFALVHAVHFDELRQARCAISRPTSARGITPVTLPPAASAASAIEPIRPTSAPP
jgi:hypothetical protein